MLIPVFKIEYNNKNITKDVSKYVLSRQGASFDAPSVKYNNNAPHCKVLIINVK